MYFFAQTGFLSVIPECFLTYVFCLIIMFSCFYILKNPRIHQSNCIFYFLSKLKGFPLIYLLTVPQRSAWPPPYVSSSFYHSHAGLHGNSRHLLLTHLRGWVHFGFYWLRSLTRLGNSSLGACLRCLQLGRVGGLVPSPRHIPWCPCCRMFSQQGRAQR